MKMITQNKKQLIGACVLIILILALSYHANQFLDLVCTEAHCEKVTRTDAFVRTGHLEKEAECGMFVTGNITLMEWHKLGVPVDDYEVFITELGRKYYGVSPKIACKEFVAILKEVAKAKLNK